MKEREICFQFQILIGGESFKLPGSASVRLGKLVYGEVRSNESALQTMEINKVLDLA